MSQTLRSPLSACSTATKETSRGGCRAAQCYAPIAGSQVSIDSTTAAGPFYFGPTGELETGATSSSGGTTRYLNVPPGDIEISVKTESGKDCRANGFVEAGPKTYTVYANSNNYVRFLCD